MFILECIVINCSIVLCVRAQLLSCVQRSAAPWTVAHQAPQSMGFSRQEYWRGLPCPPPGNLLDPGIKPRSPALLAYSLLLSHWGSPHFVYTYF